MHTKKIYTVKHEIVAPVRAGTKNLRGGHYCVLYDNKKFYEKFYNKYNNLYSFFIKLEL